MKSIIIKKENYAKMYWNELSNLNYETNALVMLAYILDVYPILKHTRYDETGVEYKELTNSFIQERINWDHKTIKKYLDLLIEKGYITQFNENKKGSVRYIHLNAVEEIEEEIPQGKEYGNQYRSY